MPLLENMHSRLFNVWVGVEKMKKGGGTSARTISNRNINIIIIIIT